MKRASGILFSVSSLPSRFGIGAFSKEAYEFVDFLEASGQSWWQVLPFGPTGYGDSPYQSFSTFAGNPYFISLDQLIAEGLLTEEECASAYWGTNEEYVDYGALYESRFRVLHTAYERFMEDEKNRQELEAFCRREKEWLDDYALFMALKIKNNNRSWTEWDELYKARDKKALAAAREILEEQVGFYCFQQYEFMKQWEKLHRYAAEHGVKILGDIPIYVALDSADAWSHPEMFDFDEELLPNSVAGCPPDAFSATGQLWGNPLYNWTYLKKHGYDWWIRRIRRCLDFYDAIRIDHFRGFDEFYAVPYGDETAENGSWKKGPGMALFKKIRQELGEVEIIAEDLGLITPTVEKLLEDSGYPGMKVLQFAFDDTEVSPYLPHSHVKNCVVYTGTHDNMTTRGWIESLSDHDRDFARRYIRSIYTDYGQFTWDFISTAQSSVADLAIVPLQDYLVKGNEARMNFPSVAAGNWQWRLKPHFLTEELARAICAMTKLYGRHPSQNIEPETEEEGPEEASETAAKA